MENAAAGMVHGRGTIREQVRRQVHRARDEIGLYTEISEACQLGRETVSIRGVDQTSSPMPEISSASEARHHQAKLYQR
jgi:hypothetical protein